MTNLLAVNDLGLKINSKTFCSTWYDKWSHVTVAHRLFVDGQCK